MLITHRPTCSAVHARSQRRGLLVGYCCAPRLLEQSLSTFAAVCFACLNRRIVIPAPTRACLLARSPQAKGKEEGQMPPSSSRGTPPSTALKTPPPGESPKGGRGDTPKSDGSDSKKGLKVGSGSSRGGSGSERTKGAKPSARKISKDSAKKSSDAADGPTDEAVLAAAEAAEEPNAPVPKEVIADEPPASPMRPLATPRAAERAAHVLEREKSFGLIPPAFFDLEDTMRDAVEALFFHSYAAEKGLTVTEVRAASRDASARLRTQTGNLQFTYAYFHC